MDSENIIYLYLHDDHFSVVSSAPAFFSRSYYCDQCDVGFNDRHDHSCIKKCPCCYNNPPCVYNKGKKCKICNRYFRSEECFNNHVKQYSNEEKSSICDRIRRCPDCKKYIYRANKKHHRCGFFTCNTCKIEVEKMDIYAICNRLMQQSMISKRT